MFNNNDERETIEQLREKYLNDLDYNQRPVEAPTTPIASKPVKVKKKRTFWPALLGAVVGGLIVGVVMFSLFYFVNPTSNNSAATVGTGTTINYTGGNAESSVEAVAQVVPQSVVGISVTGVEVTESIFGGQQQQEYSSLGSGFFVTDNGYVVTNQHVIGSQPTSITISTADDEEYPADLIWSDADLDLAIIKSDISGAPALSLGDSDNLKVGQSVIAVGNPIGLAYSRSVTAGIISGIDRTIVDSDGTIVGEGLIQTDAAINSGNSGGPLVNTAGEVIGVNELKSAVAEGLGFAIPINLFKPIINEVVETGTFAPRTIGITGYDPEQAQYVLNGQIKDFTKGFYIVDVTPGSPAQKAGLQQGDIIKSIDGKEINTLIQLRTILYNHALNDKVSITYERGGQEYTTELTLSGN